MAIQSLFGPSVADIQELRRQQAEREIAASGQEFGVFAPLYRAGSRFGRQAAEGISTLMGAQDPMLKKAADIQSVLSKYEGQDLNDPVVLTQIAGNLSGLGYANEAFSLAQTARASAREAERVNIERQRLGFEQQRLGLEQQRIGLETTRIKEAQYKDNPELIITEARSLPDDDPRKQALINKYYDVKREQQNKLAKDAAELERIQADTLRIRALAAKEGEVGIVGQPGPVGRAGAFRDVNGQVYGPAEMGKQRAEYNALGKMLDKFNNIKYEDVKNAESVFDYTQEGGIIKGAAGKIDPKTVGAQSRIAAAQLLEQIDSLPPGAASDADMKAARASFPGFGSEANLLRWINDTKTTIDKYHQDIANRFGFQRGTKASAPLEKPGKKTEQRTGETGSWSIINVEPSR